MKNDGGPAFGGYARHHNSVAGQEWFSDEPVMGMSLRDYFAAAALQSFLSHEWMTETAKQFENPAAQIAEFRAFIASKSYSYADAMLAERDKP